MIDIESVTLNDTRVATWDAIWSATSFAALSATDDATRSATWNATRAATNDATRAAAWFATRTATWTATQGAADLTAGLTTPELQAAIRNATEHTVVGARTPGSPSTHLVPVVFADRLLGVIALVGPPGDGGLVIGISLTVAILGVVHVHPS